MTLTEFLLARFAEDEALARRAMYEGEAWEVRANGTLKIYTQAASMEWEFPSGVWNCDDPEDDCDSYRANAESEAAHIVRWQPARVLAECEAKRRIVEDFEVLHTDYQVTYDPTTEARRFQARVAMAHLALPYAYHPDYREEWRP